MGLPHIERLTGRMHLMWLSVLTMIYPFGRTTGHQAGDSEAPCLAFVRLPQYQKEKIFLSSHACSMLPRRGGDTAFPCQSTGRAEEPVVEAL